MILDTAAAKVLRIAGTVLLCVTEVVLVGLFIAAASRSNAHFIDSACLLFHCFALVTILSTIIYSMFNGSRNPSDKFYVFSGCFLVVATWISFVLVLIDTIKTAPNDFASMGRSAADAVIGLSFMVAFLALISLSITIYEKLDAHRQPPPVPPKQPRRANTDAEARVYYEAKRAHSGVNAARAALASKKIAAAAAVAGPSSAPDARPESVHFAVSGFQHLVHVGADSFQAVERDPRQLAADKYKVAAGKPEHEPEPEAEAEPHADLAGMEDVPLTPVTPSTRSEETIKPAVPPEAHKSANAPKHRQMSYDLGYWSGIGRAV